ncbi:MAG TPA: mevalonate kinase [Anaerolineales bacterium]|nr:mevalonate kinase [Anaerolineales bacterium]
MPAISASAPGKVILLGEHAVVYGQPAIAVPVTQVRARAIVTAEPRQPAGSVRIQAPIIGLEARLAELPPQDPLASAARLVFAELGLSQPPALTIRVTSTIPVAAGLGSGAAVSVAIIRALSEFLGRRLPAERVSALAYEVEKLHHGTPSGIDNTVIAYARPVYFVRRQEGNLIETFRVNKPFPIVIADSGVASPTAITVGDVRRAWQAEPDRYQRLFSTVGGIVQAARAALERGEVESLGPLMDENHTLLCEMGVSSPELERLLQAACQAGALGAKLSGGGRGGNLIALVTPELTETVAQALRQAGATGIIITEVGSGGEGKG